MQIDKPRLGPRLLAGITSFALAVTASVATAKVALADELHVADWSTLAEVSPDASTAEFVSEVILGGAETLAIEPGVESDSGIIVPESLDEPITIGDLTLDVPSEPGAEAAVTKTGDVVVPSANEGAELIIQELDISSLNFEAAAARTLITIESREVDPLFQFTPEVPEGGSLNMDSETGSVIAYDGDGNISSIIAPPWAYDAEGAEVPTWFEVEDGHVYQYVDHLSRQFAYPIVADPVWFVPVLLFAGRIIIKEVASATLTAATAAAIKGVGTAAKYRSWTDGNKRHNLIIWTKKDPGNRCDAHHTLPQKFATYFASRGFTGGDSIHHPKYLVWWEKNDHRRKASAVNNSWQTWINKNRTASKASILNKRTAVLKQYPPRC